MKADFELQIKKIKKNIKKWKTLRFNTKCQIMIDLDKLKKELTKDLKSVTTELDVVRDDWLVKTFSKDNVQSHKQDGKLLSLHNQIWATRNDGVTMQDALAGLRGARVGKKFIKESVDMDKLHVMLRDSAREAEDGKPIVPENIKDYFDATEKFMIKIYKA